MWRRVYLTVLEVVHVVEEPVVEHGAGQLRVLVDALGAEELEAGRARRGAHRAPRGRRRLVHEAVQLFVDLQRDGATSNTNAFSVAQGTDYTRHITRGTNVGVNDESITNMSAIKIKFKKRNKW